LKKHDFNGLTTIDEIDMEGIGGKMVEDVPLPYLWGFAEGVVTKLTKRVFKIFQNVI
jgi:hypothetical protein